MAGRGLRRRRPNQPQRSQPLPLPDKHVLATFAASYSSSLNILTPWCTCLNSPTGLTVDDSKGLPLAHPVEEFTGPEIGIRVSAMKRQSGERKSEIG